jgi:hypothetical protein
MPIASRSVQRDHYSPCWHREVHSRRCGGVSLSSQVADSSTGSKPCVDCRTTSKLPVSSCMHWALLTGPHIVALARPSLASQMVAKNFAAPLALTPSTQTRSAHPPTRLAIFPRPRIQANIPTERLQLQQPRSCSHQTPVTRSSKRSANSVQPPPTFSSTDHK